MKNVFSRFFSLMLTVAMMCTMLSTGVFAEQTEAVSVNVADYAAMEAAQAEVLSGVYTCELVMGPGMALNLFLNIDEAGNFIFARDAEFATNEKGAGVILADANGNYAMVYAIVNGEEVAEGDNVAVFTVNEDGSLKFMTNIWFGATSPAINNEDGTVEFLTFVPAVVVDEPEIVTGDYAVDTSWAPMASAYAPVLSIDAENMTFSLADSAYAEFVPVTGAVAYEAGVYTLTAEDGRTAAFTEAEGILTITSVVTAAPAAEEVDEALSGKYHMDLTAALMAAAEDLVIEIDEETMTFKVYEAAAAESIIESGAITLTDDVYTIAYDGIEAVEGIGTTFTYADDIVTLTSVFTAAVPAPVEEEEEVGELKYGSYGANVSVDAMGGKINYAVTLKLKENGSYTLSTAFVVGGMKYSEDESGTFKVDGSKIVLVSSAGGVITGSIGANSIEISKKLSSFAASATKIDLVYGFTPSAGGDVTPPADDDEKDPEEDKEPEVEKPEVVPAELTSGAYAVDISWSPMGAMFAPVVEIDADAMTFKVYNATAPEAVKGQGTITEADGVYTMNFEGGNTTTFTSGKDTITFTSKLWYGKASFDSTGEDGVFVPYNGVKVPAQEEKTELTSGAYAVDISWSPMGAMFAPVVEIDADAMTFKVYNATAPEAVKGQGTITEADGVYTMNFEGGNTTTFTSGKDTITFTSKLWYGKASFDSTGEDGVFVPYNGVKGPVQEEEKTELVSGTYAVDTSWALGGMATESLRVPVLDIDAEKMTFDLYDKADTKTSKGNGTITEADGVFTMVYATEMHAGKTTTFTFADNTVSFTSPLFYGMARYNRTDDAGNFIIFTAKPVVIEDDGDDEDDEFEIIELNIASGDYDVDVSVFGMEEMMDPMLNIDAKANTFNLYSGKNPSESKGSGYIRYADGIYSLVYTSGLADGKVTTFTYSDETITFTDYLFYGTSYFKGDEGQFITHTATLKGADADVSTYKTGVYGGKYTNVSASGKETQYVYTIDLKEDGTYAFSSSFGMGGDVYTQTENGTYTVENGVLTIVSNGLVIKNSAGEVAMEKADSETMTGTVDANGNATITRHPSFFAAMGGSMVELPLTYGETPSLDVEEAPTYKTGVYGGKYTNVSASGKETKYVYTIDLKEDGTYAFSSSFGMGGDVYTQTENGTYTVENGVLTIVSNGLVIKNSAGEVAMEKADSETMTGTVDANGNATITRHPSFFAAMGGSMVELPLTYGETPSLDVEEAPAYKTGVYGGKYTNVSASGKETDYVYTLDLKEDGTYIYTASFNMSGDVYTQTENGTYTAEDNTLTLVSNGLVIKNSAGEVAMESAASETMTGVIDSAGNATSTRYVSYFAAMGGSKADLVFIYGWTPSLDTEEPEATEAPEMPETSEEPEMPEATEAPEVPEASEEPEMPDVSAEPEATEAPVVEATEEPGTETTPAPEATEEPAA